MLHIDVLYDKYLLYLAVAILETNKNTDKNITKVIKKTFWAVLRHKKHRGLDAFIDKMQTMTT